RHLFDVAAYGVDLSDIAVRRGCEMFGLAGAAADLGQLPFRDDAFDVTICSEVLEHVVSPEAVISELKRVSRKCVIISTPRAPDDSAREAHFRNLDPNEPHAHIHFFTDDEIRNLAGNRSRFLGARSRFINRVLNRLAWGDDLSRIQRQSYYEFSVSSAALNDASQRSLKEMLLDRYDTGPGWRRRVMTPRICGWLLAADARLAARSPRFALDHLVIIPCGEDLPETAPRCHPQRITAELLGGFRVEPYRRRDV
nr:methyltransferase domain-containing protein [bacterium]